MLHVCEKTRCPIYKNLKQSLIICEIVEKMKPNLETGDGLSKCCGGQGFPFQGTKG